MFSLSKNPTISEVHSLYKNKEANVSDVIKFFLNRIDRLDKNIKGSVRTYPNEAVKKAEELDQILQNTEFEDILKNRPLFGIPFGLKDNILVEACLATSQSQILDGYLAPYSADIVNHLNNAGAILLAQTNMDEFAFGSSTEFSGFGQITKNPHDIKRVAGGTSGGSASMVASGQLVFAIGTDTGGSIRQPASFCGIVGLRPTYGLLSRYGIMASTSSFDQPGPLTSTIQDNQTVLSVLKKPTQNDQTCLDFSKTSQFKKLPEDFTIGVPAEAFGEGLADEVRAKFEELFTKLVKNGFKIKEISLEKTIKYDIPTYYILQTVEAAANLERFDGVRFGKQVKNGEMFFAERGQFFGDEAKRRIMLGTYTSSAGYYDAYYNKACQAREVISREFAKAFEDVDVIITPVAPTPAFKIGEHSSDPVEMYLADILTTPQPIAKLPGLSINLGNQEYQGSSVPIGAQLTGPEMSEQVLYALAEKIENLK